MHLKHLLRAVLSMWRRCDSNMLYVRYHTLPFFLIRINVYLLIQKYTLRHTRPSTGRGKIVWWGPRVKGARGKISHSNRHHTTNGQLSTVNHLSALIINHIRAAKCGTTTTLSAFVRMMITSHWSCCWITAQYKTWIIISISVSPPRHNATILWSVW